MITINAKQAYRLVINECNKTPNRKFKPQTNCKYYYKGRPHCLIGKALASAGADFSGWHRKKIVNCGLYYTVLINDARINDIKNNDLALINVNLSPLARSIFNYAQDMQDNGVSWGAIAKSIKSRFGHLHA